MNDALQLEDAAADVVMGQIVDEFLERQARGERPAWEEYARRYPQFAVVLRQMLPALGLLHGSAADGLIEAPALSAELTPEGPLGDYRLVREVGRGGMGVVYEAVQISLGRRVALKVLPFAAALDDKQLQRFKNEAHAAAQLHHQNIVPVYSVGCDRGVHYYAMQFIDGQTLAAVIADLRRLAQPSPNPLPVGEAREKAVQSPPEPLAGDLLSGKWLSQSGPPTAPYMSPSPRSFRGMKQQDVNGHRPTERPMEPAASDTVRQPEAALSTENSTKNPAFFQSVAQLGIQAAQALEHSHSLGVVHRDIKPTNLLVDARANLWITDFGLAHVHNDSNLTLTGDILGTLRYMSPEQALAQRVVVDHRTDLYSLGATLYELLTLEPAFGGRDRHELLRQIAFEEPLRPRRINKAIPAEIETIVLKAMEKNPADRYATAQELANDLERFLKDEPIRAKRPSLLGRVRKWARRHRPVVASAAVATAAVVVIAVVALLISLGNISAALTGKSAALDREKEITYLQRIALAGRELAAGNVGGAEELLGECPEHLRGWEWHFLKRQRYGNAPTMQHPATVIRVVFSPDGAQIASACMDGTLTIRDARTGQVLHQLERPTGMFGGAFARGMAYSLEGRYLAVARNDGKVQVWETDNGRLLHSLEGHKEGPAWQVAFSPDSRTLASGGSDRSVRLWDLTNGQPLREFSEHPTAVKGVTFRPDGRSIVAACDDGTVKVWDRSTGTETLSFRGELAYPWIPSFSPDTRRLAWSCLDDVIKVWDTTTGRLEIDQQSNTYRCRAVAFSPDGHRIAVAGFDGTLRLLEASSGREMLTIYAHPSTVAGVAFSPDGHRLASASYDHTVRLWDATPLTSDPLTPHCVTLTGHKGRVSGVAFSPDGRWLATGSWDHTIKLWSISRTDLQSVRGISDGSQIRPTTMTLRYTLDGHRGIVAGLAFSPDNRMLASASWDNTFKLWDLQTPRGESLAEIQSISLKQRLNSIAVSPDGQLLAIGQDNGITLFELASGRPVHPFKRTPAPVPSLAFHPDMPLLISTGASDPAVKFWEVDAADFSFEIRHGSNPNPCIAVSPNGRRIASAFRDPATGEHIVKIWDMDWEGKTYPEFRTLRGHRGYVWRVAFGPDGRYLASGSWDSTVKVWDLEAPASADPVTLPGHAGFILSLAFSPDGRRLATGSGYAGHGEVKVWDATLWQDKTSADHEGVAHADY